MRGGRRSAEAGRPECGTGGCRKAGLAVPILRGQPEGGRGGETREKERGAVGLGARAQAGGDSDGVWRSTGWRGAR